MPAVVDGCEAEGKNINRTRVCKQNGEDMFRSEREMCNERLGDSQKQNNITIVMK